MWGSLTLKAIPKPPTPEKQDKNASSSSSTGLTALTTPNQIELDISKSVHHVGRLPNPSKPFTHSTQHVIPVTFLSATHFSIGIGPNSNNGTNNNGFRYWICDHSSNGTYIYRPNIRSSSNSNKHTNNITNMDVDNNAADNDDNDTSSIKIEELSVQDIVKLKKSVETPLLDGDLVIFVYSNAITLCYQFGAHTLMETAMDPLFVQSLIQSSTFTQALTTQQTHASASTSTSTLSTASSTDGTILKQQLASTQSELRACEQRYTELTSKHTQLTRTHTQQQQELTDAHTQISTLTAEKQSVESNLVDAIEKNATIQTQLTQLEQIHKHTLATKNLELSDLQSTIDTLTTELSYRSQQLTNRDELIASYNQQMEEQRVNVQSLQSQCASVSTQLAQMGAQYEKVMTVSSALQSSLSEAIQENDALKVRRLRVILPVYINVFVCGMCVDVFLCVYTCGYAQFRRVFIGKSD
jgi:predicted  nucleic acid-binding Zn-ribbon protein